MELIDNPRLELRHVLSKVQKCDPNVWPEERVTLINCSLRTGTLNGIVGAAVYTVQVKGTTNA